MEPFPLQGVVFRAPFRKRPFCVHVCGMTAVKPRPHQLLILENAINFKDDAK